jgi:hypothetical protein
VKYKTSGRNVKKSVGKKIKQYREKCGLTQEELAERVDVSQNFISAVERGISFPNPEKLVLIIEEVGVTADQIFEDVIRNSYQPRAVLLYDKIKDLPLTEQRRILAVVDVLIDEAKK